MRVVWLAAAEQDRAAIIEHIAVDNIAAAVRMDQLFSDAVARLENFPKLGHTGRIAGTREIVPHKSYRMVYAHEGETLWILALVHTSRMWPPMQQD